MSTLRLVCTHYVDELNKGQFNFHFHTVVDELDGKYEFVVITEQVTNKSLFILRTDHYQNRSGWNKQKEMHIRLEQLFVCLTALLDYWTGYCLECRQESNSNCDRCTYLEMHN